MQGNGGFDLVPSDHTYDMHQWPPFEDGNDRVRETLAQLPGESDEDYEAAVKADIQQSQQAIEPITGEKVNALSYPEGAYGTLTMDALRSQGIELTFTTQPGVNAVVQGLPQTLYSMHRITMTEDTDMENFLQNWSNNPLYSKNPIAYTHRVFQSVKKVLF